MEVDPPPASGVTLTIHKSFPALGIRFNVLICATGITSASDETLILLGDDEGKIHFLHPLEGHIVEMLETKGGSIQVLKAHPITKLAKCDLLSGDAYGVLSLFSHMELLSRQSLSRSVTAITVAVEHGEIPKIFAGDRVGSLVSLEGLDLTIHSGFALPTSPPSSIPYERRIAFIETVQVEDEHRVMSNYIVTADGSPALHFYSTTQVYIQSVTLPAKPETICTGRFTSDKMEIMVGCQDGGLYIIEGLKEARLYTNVGYSLTQIISLPLASSTRHAVGVCGHWNGVKVYHKNKMVAELITEQWIHTLDSIALGSGEFCLCLAQEDFIVHLAHLQVHTPL